MANKEILTKYIILEHKFNEFKDSGCGFSLGILKCFLVGNKILNGILLDIIDNNIIVYNITPKSLDDIKFKLVLDEGTYFDPIEGTKYYKYVKTWSCNKTFEQILNME